MLGPFLFLIYVNDLPNISKVLTFFLFADDTNIYFEADSLSRLQTVVNKELKKLYTWLIVNRLALNIDKTNFLIFHPFNKANKENVTLKINKKAIQEKSQIKYLGIILDTALNWKSHIDKISNTISKSIGIMYKIRPFVNKETLKILYYSLIYPHLTYAVEAWGSAIETQLNRLLILQKKVVRMIIHRDIRQEDYSLPASEPLFINLKIMKIRNIFKTKVSNFIFKCLNKLCPSQFHEWFRLTATVHNHNTRSTTNKDLFISKVRTTYHGKKSIKYLGPKIWNELPVSIKSINIYSTFSKKVKEFFT